jgi:hypothetical protein
MVEYNLAHLTQDDNQWVVGPIQDDEALFLYSLVRCKRIKTVFEIGGLNGYSAKNFLAAVGQEGTVYTVDICKIEPQALNHKCIEKDARNLTAEDLDNRIMDLVFFDCHEYDVQMGVYHSLVNAGLITDATIIALHDTNLHYNNDQGNFVRGPTPDKEVIVVIEDVVIGYIHQPVERRMVNDFVDMGYHPLCLHTTADRHDETMPNRHGLTILSKFEKLMV